MTLTSLSTHTTAGEMSDRVMWVYTHTNTTDLYEVVATLKAADLANWFHTMVASVQNALVKIEYSRNDTTYYTVVTDMPITAAATAYFTHVQNASNVRISVKNAGAGQNTTIAWTVAASQLPISSEYRWAFTHEAKTVTNAAVVSLTQATYLDAALAIITVENNTIKVRWDGSDPTTTTGHTLQAGDTLKLELTGDIYHFRAIASGADAIIRVTYSR